MNDENVESVGRGQVVTIRRALNPSGKQFPKSASLTAPVHRALKLHCTISGAQAGEVASKAVRAWLLEHGDDISRAFLAVENDKV